MHILRFNKRNLPKALLIALAPFIFLISVHFLVKAEDAVSNLFFGGDSTNAVRIVERPLDIAELNIGSDILFEQSGVASYYGRRFHNRRTANGEKYNMYEFSAAHKKLPFGTILRVTNLETQNTVLVRINDRGPFVGKRIIDLSWHSAKELDNIGLGKVRIEGFLPGDNEREFDSTEIYYFGYSYSGDLVCLPETAIEVVDSTRRFHKAVVKYDSYLAQNPEEMAYIFVRADQNPRRESRKTGYIYMIGQVRKERVPVVESVLAAK
ncbi:MAG: septal ring lytic transglycosylase RlpA family protein [Bacteroidota bacterium]